MAAKKTKKKSGKSKLTSTEKNIAVVAHLGGFTGFIVPFGNILAPFLVWLFKKEDSKFIADSAKEALNFQITMTIAAVVSLMLTVILIGFIGFIAVFVLEIVHMIKAAIAASEGKVYVYPMSKKFIN